MNNNNATDCIKSEDINSHYMESEDFQLKYENRTELSYVDKEKEYVELYYNENKVCDIEVWTDRSGSNREYIIINHTIVYLDDLEKLDD